MGRCPERQPPADGGKLIDVGEYRPPENQRRQLRGIAIGMLLLSSLMLVTEFSATTTEGWIVKILAAVAALLSIGILGRTHTPRDK